MDFFASLENGKLNWSLLTYIFKNNLDSTCVLICVQDSVFT